MFRIIGGCLIAIGITEAIKVELRYQANKREYEAFFRGLRFATQTAPSR